MKTAHLYQIVNLLNGKIYIGVSVNPGDRIKQHLFEGTGSKLVAGAVTKYGVENFESKILTIGEEDYVYDLEVKAIAAFGAQVPNGYNIAEGGNRPPKGTGGTGWPKGKPRSQETKAKMSSSASKRVWSQVVKDKMSAAKVGKKFTAEHKAALSKSKTGLVKIKKIKG
jgi:group I intron endonuclease